MSAAKTFLVGAVGKILGRGFARVGEHFWSVSDGMGIWVLKIFWGGERSPARVNRRRKFDSPETFLECRMGWGFGYLKLGMGKGGESSFRKIFPNEPDVGGARYRSKPYSLIGGCKFFRRKKLAQHERPNRGQAVIIFLHEYLIA